MLKQEKIKFVQELKKEIKKYKLVGVLSVQSVPDRLIQKVRNQLRPKMKLISARKSLLLKAIEGDKRLEQLVPFVSKNVVLLLSNEEPIPLYGQVTASRLKLSAKPGQIANEDIVIEPGETTLQPGPAVTELKTNGLDVAIQKGKVVISKRKVLVPKGGRVDMKASKILKTLDVTPFEAMARIDAAVWENLLFRGEVLAIGPEKVSQQIAVGFNAANVLSTDIGYITKYNVDSFIKRAFLGAVGIGVSSNSLTAGKVDKALEDAIAKKLGKSQENK